MKETAHFRITAQEAKELYLSGLFTTHAYLYILVKALRKDGWWLYFDSITEFCQEWGIPERSFYRAKAILVSQGYLEEIIQGRLGLRCPVENEELQQVAEEARRLPVVAADGNEAPATSGSWPAKSGSHPATSGSQTAKSGSDTASKPAQDKASTAPSDLSQISRSDLLQIEGDEDCLNKNDERDGLVEPEAAGGAIDVAKILEETRKQLLAVVERQREARERRNFRGGTALGAAALGALEDIPSGRTTTTSSSHGGHGERYGQGREDIPSEDHPGAMATYMWRVRGGGLQPMGGILEAMGYHRNRPPFSRGIP